jgi:ECF transporter, substrate-specific component
MIRGYTKSLVFTALFAGLAYISNFFVLIIPNVSPAFFVIFMAGYFLGFRWGAVTGSLSFFFISYFNPYGMAMLPLLAAQILGGTIVGLCGALAFYIFPIKLKDWRTYPLYALWGIISSSIYMGLVSLADAVLFGPFQERLLISLGFSMLTIVSNLIIFPVLAPLINSVREIVGDSG